MQKTKVEDVNVTVTAPLLSPNDLDEHLPITEEIADHVVRSRAQIEAILNGTDDRLFVIVGPCSIHDEAAALEYAGRLAALAEKLSDRLFIVMRVYFEKPRTTVGWKGFIYDPGLDDSFDINAGITRARALLLKLNEMGIYAATEFLDPVVPQYLAEFVTWACIGARTVESQTHRQMASGLSMPVGFKNSTEGAIQPAVDAMVAARSPHAFLGIDHEGRTCIVHTRGNPLGHLVLRGGSTGTNFGSDAISSAHQRMEAAGVNPRVMIDCSHGNSNKDFARQNLGFKDVIGQRLSGEGNIIGCMLESHLHPGNQKVPADLSELKYGVSVTDACIGWEETEELLTWAHGQVGG